MQVNLINEGLLFMVLGMGGVFLFLILMVLVLNIQAKIFHYFHRPLSPNPCENAHTSPQTPSSQGELIAVISAAINKYKKEQKHG